MNKLLLIDDESDVQYSFGRIFTSSDIELHTADSGESGLKLMSQSNFDLIIMDVRMGGMNGLETLRHLRQIDARVPVIMMTAYGTTQTAIEAMKLGAYDYLLKPFDVPRLKRIVEGALKASNDMKQVVSYQPLLESEDYNVGIVGRSEVMQNVFKLIGQLAASDATALITGESGTGKELVARAIYHHSKRHERPFLAINCAAIPENLLESELFGHEKGAFTGATSQRIGKFEQSDRGTLFLDEIGDMTPATQTKILRVLQSGTFERVGGSQPIQVDVRVIAATNKPLEEAVARREFRDDLFYRLNVVRIRMPSLRERRSDIPLLINYFLRKFAGKPDQPPKSIATSAVDLLAQHTWPGNVRELENVIQRAHVVAKGDVILPSDLPSDLLRHAETSPDTASASAPASASVSAATPGVHDEAPAAIGPGPGKDADRMDLNSLVQQLFQWAKQDPEFKVIPAVERTLIIHALESTGGNQVQAAALLGITRATLRKRIDRFNIRKHLQIN